MKGRWIRSFSAGGGNAFRRMSDAHNFGPPAELAGFFYGRVRLLHHALPAVSDGDTCSGGPRCAVGDPSGRRRYPSSQSFAHHGLTQASSTARGIEAIQSYTGRTPGNRLRDVSEAASVTRACWAARLPSVAHGHLDGRIRTRSRLRRRLAPPCAPSRPQQRISHFCWIFLGPAEGQLRQFT